MNKAHWAPLPMAAPTRPTAARTVHLVPDTVQVENPNIDRFASAVISILPFLGLFWAAERAWNHSLHPRELVMLGVGYLLTGFGVTVGLHRLLTHRSFRARRPVKITFAILASMAIEGPIIEWVANHRQHHAFSDIEGDPHSPHEHGGGFRGALAGLWHAHIGWVFSLGEGANEERYAPDLLRDRDIKLISDTFVVWALLSVGLPAAAGWLVAGGEGALDGLIWGGLIRIFLVHHITFSINSLCHFFGRREYETGDESRNLAWLAPLTFGESWHNNHHAFPTSARHGLGRRQLDPSARLIALLQKLGLASEVVTVSADRRRTLART